MNELISINPFTSEEIDRYPQPTDLQIEKAIENANEAFSSWRRTSMVNRSELLLKASEILLSRKESLGKTMVSEMMPLSKRC